MSTVTLYWRIVLNWWLKICWIRAHINYSIFIIFVYVRSLVLIEKHHLISTVHKNALENDRSWFHISTDTIQYLFICSDFFGYSYKTLRHYWYKPLLHETYPTRIRYCKAISILRSSNICATLKSEDDHNFSILYLEPILLLLPPYAYSNYELRVCRIDTITDRAPFLTFFCRTIQTKFPFAF